MSVDRRLYEIPVSGHISGYGQSLEDIDPSEEITLPHDVPSPPSLAQLPHSILHSATVETLIGQNEDLHARLTVTIRMNAQLERRLIELEQNQNDQRNMNGSLISQLQIFQEKDGSWKSRLDEVEKIIETKSYESERQHVEIDLLQKQLNDKTSAFEALKARLIEASSHIQAQEKSLGDLQSTLSAEFEERLASVLSEYSRQTEQVKELEKRAAHLAKLDEARIETENRAIYFERRSQELEGKFAGELHEVQAQLDKYRVEAKTLATSLQTKSEEHAEQSRDARQAKAELIQMSDQFESLQTIWHEGQRRLDESRLKNEALTKINAELSRKLKELRRLDGLSPASALTNENPVASGTFTQHDTSANAASHQTKIDRIESLLAGIQAGFPQSMIESGPKAQEKDQTL